MYDTIIELAAVKIRGGEIIDKFEAFANPHHPLSATTIELTGITDDMVRDAPDVVDVVRDFKEWIGDDVLVAHNASFDMGFLNVAYKRLLKTEKRKIQSLIRWNSRVSCILSLKSPLKYVM